MNIAIYGVRPDEEIFCHKYGETYKHKLTLISEFLTQKSLPLAQACEGIITIDTPCDRALIKSMSEMGIKYLGTRTAGYGNFDLSALKEFGISFSNVPTYSPNSVAEFEVLSTLALIRNYKELNSRCAVDNFSIVGLIGLEIRNLALGFIGLGNIGKTAAQCFLGFKPKKMLGFDLHSEQRLSYIEYMPLAPLLEQSDVILLNVPLTADNYHMINSQSLSSIKKGAFLVNCARGALVDTQAVLDALDRGILSGYVADVYEHEDGIVHKDYSQTGLEDTLLKKLIAHPKVIYTPHSAFYTDEAVSNMIETSLYNMDEYQRLGLCINEKSITL